MIRSNWFSRKSIPPVCARLRPLLVVVGGDLVSRQLAAAVSDLVGRACRVGQ